MKWMTLDQVMRYATRLITGESGQTIEELLTKIDANAAKIQPPSDQQVALMVSESVDIAAFFKEQEETLSYYIKTKENLLLQCRIPFQRDLLTNGRLLGFGFHNPRSNQRMLIPMQSWAFLEIDFARSTAAGHGYFFGGLQFLDPKEVSGDDRNWLREQLLATKMPAGAIVLVGSGSVATPPQSEKSAGELKESKKQATLMRNKQWADREAVLRKDNPAMTKNEAARIIAREHNATGGNTVTWESVARILRN